MPRADIAVAVLAAGSAIRFGSDKLMADMDGLPLGLHIARTLEPMGFGWRFAVCRSDEAYTAFGFDIIANHNPEVGQSHSLHLAVQAAMATQARALLVVLADMPFVSAKHIGALMAAYVGKITASTDGATPMPPAIFPRSTWPMLLATTGDSGGRRLLENAVLVAASPEELRDVDLPADLLRPRSQ